MSDKQAYLAARYMSGPKADAILSRTDSSTTTAHKKKKRKLDKVPRGEAVGGIGVVDEDAFAGFAGDGGEEEEVDAPVVADDLKSFQRAKKSAWQKHTPQGDTPPPPPPPPPPPNDNDEPRGSGTLPPAPAAPVTKKRGGLLTAEDLREEAAALAARRAAEDAARAAEASASASAAPVDPRQTIYRDKSGAIIDVVAAERAERAAREEELRKEAEKREWGKGLVQREARERRARTEQSMGKKDVARYANDKEMNDELRAVERADDPAAAFLTKRKSKGPQRPKYTGPPAPPNRFNILPGYRWDGVDRSTGFEAKLFQTMNNRARRQVEANAWSMEDM